MNGRFIANDDHELKKKQSELLLANIQGHFFFSYWVASDYIKKSYIFMILITLHLSFSTLIQKAQ